VQYFGKIHNIFLWFLTSYAFNSAQLHFRPSAVPVMSEWPRWFSGVVYWSVELFSGAISARSCAWRTAAVWKTGSLGGPYTFHLSDIPLDRRHSAGRSRSTSQVSNTLRYCERLPHQILPSYRRRFFIFMFIQNKGVVLCFWVKKMHQETQLNNSRQINVWQQCWVTKLGLSCIFIKIITICSSSNQYFWFCVLLLGYLL